MKLMVPRVGALETGGLRVGDVEADVDTAETDVRACR